MSHALASVLVLIWITTRIKGILNGFITAER